MSARKEAYIEEFRTIIRVAAAEAGVSVPVYLRNLFEHSAALDVDGSRYITRDVFDKGIMSMNEVRGRLTRAQLKEVFDECDASGRGKVAIDEVVELCQKTISDARASALKLRAVLVQDYADEQGYRDAFDNIDHSGKYVDKHNFKVFAGQHLNEDISDSEAAAMFSIFDTDNDGKLSIDDFLGFVMAEQTVRAGKVLNPDGADYIVDVQLSNTASVDTTLRNTGYEHVSSIDLQGRQRGTQEGTFGRGGNLWIWRRSQGTCGGRLKPILDIQLESVNHNSAMVMAGYTCLTKTAVGGGYLWIKRAQDMVEDEDAIVDVAVSTGKAKVASDPMHDAPGAGQWLRVDGNFGNKGFTGGFDAFLWMRAAKPRGMDVAPVSPLKAALVLSTEQRGMRLCLAVRQAIRSYIPTTELKAINDFFYGEEGATAVRDNDASSRRLYDFSTLYHNYGAYNKMTPSGFGKLITDVGAAIDGADVSKVFYFFDANVDGSITREEYNHVLALNSHEIDLCCEAAKLKATGKFQIKGVLHKMSGSPMTPGGHSLRVTQVLSELFRMCNLNGDGIISLSEMHYFLMRMEIFMTEGEVREVIKMMDKDGDDRVEEGDFIRFMRADNTVHMNKARRVMDSAGQLRIWLQRGMRDDVPGLGATIMKSFGFTSTSDVGDSHTLVKQVWAKIKKSYEIRNKTTFPDYLTAGDFQILAAILGTRLSGEESRDLCLMAAPDKAGRVFIDDLETFISRPVRSLGEMYAILERGMLKDPIGAFKRYQDFILHEGSENSDLTANFYAQVDILVQGVERAAAIQDNGGGGGVVPAPQTPMNPGLARAMSMHSASGHATTGVAGCTVSIPHLKVGIETTKAAANTTSFDSSCFLNEEEWACLAIVVGDLVSTEDFVGVRVRDFIVNISMVVVGIELAAQVSTTGARSPAQESKNLDACCRELQRLIRGEAQRNQSNNEMNYRTAFELFDLDKEGSIDLKEFREMLIKLQLMDNIGDKLVTSLLKRFDKQMKGYVTYEDFIAFAENSDYGLQGGPDEEIDMDDDDMIGISSNTPPAKITRSAPADWMLWHVYCQCAKQDPTDPEGMVTELGQVCEENDIGARGCVTVRELWSTLDELKIRGRMTRDQYEQAMLVFTDNGTSDNEDTVDHEALCRYIVRMGRAFNKLMQERKKVDDERYKELKTALMRELRQLGEVETTGSRGLLAASDGAPTKLYRFEHVMKRVDEDGDGKLNVVEFKKVLKRLKVKDERGWNYRMIRRLFDDFDSNMDGMLDVEEFKALVLESVQDGGYVPRRGNTRDKSNRTASAFILSEDLSDDDEDDPVFSKRNAALATVSDSEIMRKVTDTLVELVPVSRDQGRSHIDSVRNAVRRFFRKSDPNGTGTVPEERFRAFCRRSGLQEKLSSSELRRLVSVLRKANKGRVLDFNPTIDYNRFCIEIGGGGHAFSTLATGASSHVQGIPISKTEALLARLATAAAAAAAAGRPFTSLCSLVDHSLTGQLSGEELIKTFRIMGATITSSDLEVLAEGLPSGAVTKDGRFDYRDVMLAMDKAHDREVRTLSQTRSQSGYVRETHLDASHRHIPLAETVDRHGNAARSLDMSTPAGVIQTPARPEADHLSRSADYTTDNLAVHAQRERTLSGLVGRVVAAYTLRGMSGLALIKALDSFDHAHAGYLPRPQFQSALESLGVFAAEEEISAASLLVPGPVNGCIDHGRFAKQVLAAPGNAHPETTAGTGVGSASLSQPPAAPTAGTYASGVAGGTAPYLTSRAAARYKQLALSTQSPVEAFQYEDRDRSGAIPRRVFAAILERLGLVVTEAQLMRACDDFTDLSDRGAVRYEEFCSVMEEYTGEGGRGRSFNPLPERRPMGDFYPETSGSDRENIFNRSHVNNWLQRSASPQERREFEAVVDSLNRFRYSSDDAHRRGERLASYGDREQRWAGRDRERSSSPPPKERSWGYDRDRYRDNRDDYRGERGRDGRDSSRERGYDKDRGYGRDSRDGGIGGNEGDDEQFWWNKERHRSEVSPERYPERDRGFSNGRRHREGDRERERERDAWEREADRDYYSARY